LNIRLASDSASPGNGAALNWRGGFAEERKLVIVVFWLLMSRLVKRP
jgi:hypothetical protein